MPFILYDVAGEPGQQRYSYVRGLMLAGKSGPVAKHVALKNAERKIPFTWHTSAQDLVALSGGFPNTQAIVIDLKPRVSENVSLYRLLDIWGFSYAEWTPLALRLRSLFVDRTEPNALAFKGAFVHTGSEHSLVGEFLYMQGGVSSGTWNWGMVGRVNGALLWRDAFDYLSRSLAETLTEVSA